MISRSTPHVEHSRLAAHQLHSPSAALLSDFYGLGRGLGLRVQPLDIGDIGNVSGSCRDSVRMVSETNSVSHEYVTQSGASSMASVSGLAGSTESAVDNIRAPILEVVDVLRILEHRGIGADGLRDGVDLCALAANVRSVISEMLSKSVN